jgi:4'-phosphopantetheinyl transferase
MTTAAATPARRPSLWFVRLDAEVQHYDVHWRNLDKGERARALRFRQDADRLRFVVARGSLRRLLGERLGMAPAAVTFATNAWGKPMLPPSAHRLHFNTSHAGDWVVHAAHDAAPVGVDVERVRDDLADVDALRHVFTEPELARLRAVEPAAQRARAVAVQWVRKEAYVKAVGEGLSRPPQGIEIDTDAAHRPRLRHDLGALPGEPDGEPGWCFDDLAPDDDHVGCLVWRSGNDARDAHG